VTLATCTQIPTNPATVFSLHVDSIPSPSVVAGDTMRDSTGLVHPLTGEAYNVQNQVLTNVLVRFISLNPNQLSITSLNYALGAATGDSIASAVADANGLQSLPFQVPVVLRPDSLQYADSDSITTLALSVTNSDSNVSPGLDIILKHNPDSIDADSVTRSYLLHYQIIYPDTAAMGTGTPSDTALFAYLADPTGNPSRRDTTDLNGMGTRQVIFQLAKIPPGTQDSIVVLATALYRTGPVAGSPLRFVVHYTSPGTPSSARTTFSGHTRRAPHVHR
jgi:hypothetical protein